MDPEAFLDWCYQMVEQTMFEYGYPKDREDEDGSQEIPLLKAA